MTYPNHFVSSRKWLLQIERGCRMWNWFSQPYVRKECANDCLTQWCEQEEPKTSLSTTAEKELRTRHNALLEVTRPDDEDC